VITLAAIIGATLSKDFATFTAFRTLQGLFGTIPQVVGLPIIHDMYAPEGEFCFQEEPSAKHYTFVSITLDRFKLACAD
jgi:hypothetical protein